MTASLLRAAVLLTPLLFLAGIFLVTAGTDETWILLGVRGLAEFGQFRDGLYRCDTSTAGPHTLISLLLYLLGGGRLEVIRFLSPVAWALLLWVGIRLLRRAGGARGEACWIGLAAVVAARGTFMLGAQAYGEILATLFVAAGALSWGTLEAGSRSRRLWTGVLLGLAAGTRLNCILAPLALPLAALASGPRRRGELNDSAWAGLLAIGLFGAQFLVLEALSGSPDPGEWAAARAAYGLGCPFRESLAYLVPERLNFWMVGEDFLPVVLLVLVTLGWAWARRGDRRAASVDVLVAFGWLLWGAWHLKAPIAHLRYLWPALFSFALAGGLVLARLYRNGVRNGAPALRWGALAVALAAILSGYLDGARAYLNGDGDVLSWEWHRAARQSLQYGPLSAVRGQRRIVDRLERLPPGEGIATLGFDTALGFLSHRPVVPLEAYYPERDPGLYGAPDRRRPQPPPRWLALVPFVNRFPHAYLTPALHAWIEENCTLEGKYGPYVLYRLLGPLPVRGEIFRLSSWEPPLPLVSRTGARPISRVPDGAD